VASPSSVSSVPLTTTTINFLHVVSCVGVVVSRCRRPSAAHSYRATPALQLPSPPPHYNTAAPAAPPLIRSAAECRRPRDDRPRAGVESRRAGGRAAGRAGVRRVNISGTINQRHVKRDTGKQTPTETRTDRYTQTDRRPDAGAINLVSSSGPAPSARVGGCR